MRFISRQTQIGSRYPRGCGSRPPGRPSRRRRDRARGRRCRAGPTSPLVKRSCALAPRLDPALALVEPAGLVGHEVEHPVGALQRVGPSTHVEHDGRVVELLHDPAPAGLEHALESTSARERVRGGWYRRAPHARPATEMRDSAIGPGRSRHCTSAGDSCSCAARSAVWCFRSLRRPRRRWRLSITSATSWRGGWRPTCAWSHRKGRGRSGRCSTRRGSGPGGGSLDVGCSTGAWLEVARDAGWQPIGIEIGDAFAQVARGRGFEAHTGTLAEVAPGLEPHSFALITFWDVLEHLPEPRAALEQAAGLLAPGGAIALTFPNVAGLYPRPRFACSPVAPGYGSTPRFRRICTTSRRPRRPGCWAGPASSPRRCGPPPCPFPTTAPRPWPTSWPAAAGGAGC